MGDEPPRICNGERYDTEEGQIVARIKRKVRAKRIADEQSTQTVAALPSKNTEHTRGGRTYTYIWADCRALVGGLTVCRACWAEEKNISKKKSDNQKKITWHIGRRIFFLELSMPTNASGASHRHTHQSDTR